MSEDILMCSGKGTTTKLNVISSGMTCLYGEYLLGPPRETSLSRKEHELQSHFQMQMIHMLYALSSLLDIKEYRLRCREHICIRPDSCIVPVLQNLSGQP